MKFKFKKGKHTHTSLQNRLRILFSGKFRSFKVKFSENAWYPYKNSNSWDFNKLYGLRYILGDHINEADLVWLPIFRESKFYPKFKEDGWIGIWGGYGYENQKRFNHNPKVDEPLAFVKVKQWVDTAIGKYDWGYEYEAGGRKEQKQHENPQTGYTIQPFFGGNNTPDNEFEIELK